MAKKELSLRKNWQTIAGKKGEKAEDMVKIILEYAAGEDYEVITKPDNFKHIYEDVELSDGVKSKIYNPDVTWKHGMVPDLSIKNTKTGKTLFIEVKRQDGWVENKPRSAGRGNVHERWLKFLERSLKYMIKTSFPF